MFKDKKILIIIVLTFILGYFISKPIVDVREYEKELESLEVEYGNITKSLDSLIIMNDSLDNDLILLRFENDSINKELDRNSEIIEDLKDDKNEIFNYVNGLDADGTRESFTKYLKQRKS